MNKDRPPNPLGHLGHTCLGSLEEIPRPDPGHGSQNPRWVMAKRPGPGPHCVSRPGRPQGQQSSKLGLVGPSAVTQRSLVEGLGGTQT